MPLRRRLFPLGGQPCVWRLVPSSPWFFTSQFVRAGRLTLLVWQGLALPELLVWPRLGFAITLATGPLPLGPPLCRWQDHVPICPDAQQRHGVCQRNQPGQAQVADCQPAAHGRDQRRCGARCSCCGQCAATADGGGAMGTLVPNLFQGPGLFVGPGYSCRQTSSSTPPCPACCGVQLQWQATTLATYCSFIHPNPNTKPADTPTPPPTPSARLQWCATMTAGSCPRCWGSGRWTGYCWMRPAPALALSPRIPLSR